MYCLFLINKLLLCRQSWKTIRIHSDSLFILLFWWSRPLLVILLWSLILSLFRSKLLFLCKSRLVLSHRLFLPCWLSFLFILFFILCKFLFIILFIFSFILLHRWHHWKEWKWHSWHLPWKLWHCHKWWKAKLWIKHLLILLILKLLFFFWFPNKKITLTWFHLLSEVLVLTKNLWHYILLQIYKNANLASLAFSKETILLATTFLVIIMMWLAIVIVAKSLKKP